MTTLFDLICLYMEATFLKERSNENEHSTKLIWINFSWMKDDKVKA